MEKYFSEVCAFIDSHRDAMLADWKELTNLEGKAAEVEKMTKVAEHLKAKFEETGMKVDLVNVGDAVAPAVVGVLGADRPGKPVMFGGHFDTVFAAGMFGENPFRIEDGKAYGPGALDMKGGIIMSLYVIKALNSVGYNERPIKVVWSSDEEPAHEHSSCGELYLKECAGGICAFNMETGRADNHLCIGRKASENAVIVVNGIESHAGNDFTAGRSAIAEMALKVNEIVALTDLEKGTTVNVGLIKGGTVPNAVPARCEITLNMRFSQASEITRVENALTEICSKSHIDGTSATLTFIKGMPLYETTEGVKSFHNFVNKVAKEYGFEEMPGEFLGGGSDASYITQAGTPCICSFGVRGEWNHTDREYAMVDTLFERTKLISAIILNLKNFN